MFVQDVFEQLSFGELYNISLGGSGCKGVPVCDYPMIINHINLGLLELYKRFPIKINQLIIILYPEIIKYRLDKKYATSNTESTEPIKYIHDSVEVPFNNDIIKIERIFNEDGQELFLNVTNAYWSVQTPEYNVVQCNYPDEENSLLVEYRAKPDTILIPAIGLHPETTEILLPEVLNEALLNYVAARVYANLNPDGSMGEGKNYYMQFERSIKEVLHLGLINYDYAMNYRLEGAGWL